MYVYFTEEASVRGTRFLALRRRQLKPGEGASMSRFTTDARVPLPRSPSVMKESSVSRSLRALCAASRVSAASLQREEQEVCKNGRTTKNRIQNY